MSPEERRRRFRLGPRSAVLLVLGALVATEWGLSLAGFGQLAAIEVHPVLGWRKIPGQSKPGRSGEGISINSWGMRDREWAAPAAAELSVHEGGRRGLRVALLGDSIAYAPGVRVEDGLARQIEAELAEQRGTPDVLVMNFSLPGYVLEQSVRAYEELARAWAPDVVVFVVNTGCLRPMLPVPEASDYPLRRWLACRATWDFLQRRVMSQASVGPALAEASAARDRLIRDPDGEAALAQTKAAQDRLQALAGELEERGAALVLLVVPRGEELRADGGAALLARWRALASSLPGVQLVNGVRPLREVFRPWWREMRAAGYGPNDVWGEPGLAEAQAFGADERNVFRVEDVHHLTPRGHRCLSEALVQALDAKD